MKLLVYRTYLPHGSFQAEVETEAARLSATLPFNTREEYLSWVKQWKEDYKAVWRSYQIEKYTAKYNACVNVNKVAYYKKKLESIPALTEQEQVSVKRCTENARELYKDKNPEKNAYRYDWTVVFTTGYWLVIFMLVQRRASKIRAKIKREERLAQQAA
jgi:hypothetical protein